ncbi:MAG: vWA domain-containing protein [Pseudomonadota bacterium]
MRRPGRGIEIFSMSALDILAMATGAFVVMVTLMLPYYQRVLDAQAQTEEVREAEQVMLAEKADLEEDTAAVNVAAGQIESDFEAAAAKKASLEEQIAEIQKRIGQLQGAARQSRRTQSRPSNLQSTVVDKLDVVFVIDTTRSMIPALQDLSRSLRGIVRVLQRLVPSVRVGVAAYTDADTGFNPVRALPLTDTGSSLPRVLGFVRSLGPPPRGSRTLEEDVELGLSRALSMNWRRDAQRVIVVIGDAEAHRRDRGRAFALASRFQASTPKSAVSTLFVSTPSSRRAGNRARPFFRSLAGAGGGKFNDHTGQMFESVILAVLVN